MNRFCLLFAMSLLPISSVAEAGRCTYSPVRRTVECCGQGEQAVFHRLLNQTQCYASTTLESCSYNDVLNRVQCCEDDKEAVWHESLRRVICCNPESPSERDCQFNIVNSLTSPAP
jgi:hypothetical protein